MESWVSFRSDLFSAVTEFGEVGWIFDDIMHHHTTQAKFDFGLNLSTDQLSQKDKQPKQKPTNNKTNKTTEIIMTFYDNTAKKSILVIGATGRTGLECIRALSKHQSRPQIHGFCRDPSKLSENDKNLCDSIVTGNARNKGDIEKALRQTNANVVLVSVGMGDSTQKTDIRTASAEALASVLKKPEYGNIRAMIVSSNGAGGSRIIVGFGIGKLIEFHLRHVLKDHDGQENAFRSNPALLNRTCIVRPTSLTDNEATNKLVVFGDREKPKTIKTDRADVAAWVTKAICDQSVPGGKIVNVTGVKM